MNGKVILLGLMLLGMCLLASAQPRRVRLAYGDYECSCSYHCPRYGIKVGRCYDNDYWGWGQTSHCCVPSYLDYDAPDMNNNFYSVYFGRRR